MTDKHPIILTDKQREAIIHCTRLRRGLKARLERVRQICLARKIGRLYNLG